MFPKNFWIGERQWNAARATPALERAVSLHQDDNVARLYLGLTLTRSGNREQGLKEIESGMRGLHKWLDDVNQYAAFFYGQYWDPANEIRSEIKNSLAMISGKEIDWEKLMASGEWVGKKIEEEIDIARRQESRDRSRRDESSGD